MKHYSERDESNSYFEFNNNDYDISDDQHKKDVRRKLEQRMELRRLKAELEDYEGELDDDFDWSDVDK